MASMAELMGEPADQPADPPALIGMNMETVQWEPPGPPPRPGLHWVISLRNGAYVGEWLADPTIELIKRWNAGEYDARGIHKSQYEARQFSGGETAVERAERYRREVACDTAP